MKRFRLVAGVMAFALLAVAAQPVAAATTDPYIHYVACSWSKTAPPSHSCPKSSRKAAFFKSKAASVTYRACVHYPTNITLCANAQSAPKGTKVKVTISSTAKGQHSVKWYVNSVQVGAWTFDVT